MSITTIDNHLIHYEVLGRGQPLIFIHGWLGSWRYWWPSMQAMSSQYRSFAFDLWGFGDSSKAPDFYSVDAYITMVDQFIDQLGVARPVHIIGHSLGAVVGLHYAMRYPANVDKLITVSLPVHGDMINSRLLDSDADTAVNRVVGKSNSFPEVDGELRKIDPDAYTALFNEVAASDYTSDLAELERQVLLLYGEQDPVIYPPTGKHDFLRDSRDNRFFVSLDCQHYPMLQEKTQFNRLLLDFFLAGDDLTELSPKKYWSRRTR